jgi:hypothetical protein
MSLDEELEEIEKRRAVPPAVLFKYVHPDRVDVLKNASIRFTPPLNTNDIFEVRQTFDLVMGPKMLALFKEVSKDVDFTEQFEQALKESPLGLLNAGPAKDVISTLLGTDVEALARGILGECIDLLPSHLNTPESIEILLNRLASNLLLLSLSERQDSSPMWAHYAANSMGFVIAFDTSSDFFRRGEHRELQGLHKVEYFDGRVTEIVDNPYAALISKQADWEYEHEWRLYAKTEDVVDVRELNGDQLHLVQFPRDAVTRVILGLRTSEEVSKNIRSVLRRSYPNTILTQIHADRTTATLVELTVE